MKNKLSNHIQYLQFDENLFNEIYNNNPNEIKNNYSLLYKSLAINNSMAFLWLLNKIDIEPIFGKLIPFVFRKKRKLAHYSLLKKAYPQVFNKPENMKIVFNILFNHSASDEIGKRAIKYMGEISRKYSIIDSFMLERLVNQKQTHNLMIEHMKLGVIPNHINNFFAEYCKYGSPENIEIFKHLGCDIHYLNDLSLLKASEYINEPMIFHLINNEGSDLSVGNYFCVFSLLNEDEYSLLAQSSDDIISFVAEKILEKKSISKATLNKFLTHKKFNTAYEYFSAKNDLVHKNLNSGHAKTRVNKI
jgi:hypothetical protein